GHFDILIVEIRHAGSCTASPFRHGWRRPRKAGTNRRHREREFAIPVIQAHRRGDQIDSRCTEDTARTRTACLTAERRLKMKSADVLSFRQQDCSEIDYCWSPMTAPFVKTRGF